MASSTAEYNGIDVEMAAIDSGNSVADNARHSPSPNNSGHHNHQAPAITSRQPTFPSEYAHREGNASMLAILGFVMATLTAGCLDLFAPEASHATIWLYLVSFGGLLQIYAGIKDFEHGNTLTACIFLLFGFHWVSAGTLGGDLLFIQNTTLAPGAFVDQSVIGCYYISFTLFTAMLTVCTYLNPQGSYLLVTILSIVVVKLILMTINSWTPHTELKQTSGFLGILVCLLAFYSFFAESLAEHGTVIPTGKFAGVKSRSEVKTELLAKKKKQ